MLKTISKDLEQVKLNMDTLLQTSGSSDEMYKVLNAKLDLFKNLDMESRENLADNKGDKRPPTKPSFFKQIFMEDREKYLNTLYTQDEIDAVYAHEDVVKKKKECDKARKAGALLYDIHIKKNFPEGRASAFESIYTQFYP